MNSESKDYSKQIVGYSDEISVRPGEKNLVHGFQ